MKPIAIAAGLTAAGIWGGMYVVSKVVLDVIPPFTLLSLRLAFGALSIAAIFVGRGWNIPRPRTILSVLLTGFIGYGLSLGLQFAGTRLSTAANASLVTSASPAFIFLFGILFLGERATRARMGALTLATLGVLAVVDLRQVLLGSEVALGNLMLLGAAMAWGLYSVFVKRVSNQIGVFELSVLAILGGLFVSLPASFAEGETHWLGEMDIGLWLGVLYLGVVSTGFAVYLWNRSLAELDAGFVSILFFAQPVVGVILGAVLLGESLGVGFWVGAVLIGAGLLIAARAEQNGM